MINIEISKKFGRLLFTCGGKISAYAEKKSGGYGIYGADGKIYFAAGGNFLAKAQFYAYSDGFEKFSVPFEYTYQSPAVATVPPRILFIGFRLYGHEFSVCKGSHDKFEFTCDGQKIGYASRSGTRRARLCIEESEKFLPHVAALLYVLTLEMASESFADVV